MRRWFALFAVVLVAGCQTMMSPATISRERIAEIVASPDRSAADRKNDLRRKPEEMLAFIGLREGMLALDISAGGGYTTELAGPATFFFLILVVVLVGWAVALIVGHLVWGQLF